MNGEIERCACDDPRCHTGSGLASKKQCQNPAVCVVILRYQRSVRVQMCRPCAEWWVKNDRGDGVVASLQVGAAV